VLAEIHFLLLAALINQYGSHSVTDVSLQISSQSERKSNAQEQMNVAIYKKQCYIYSKPNTLWTNSLNSRSRVLHQKYMLIHLAKNFR